MLSPFRPDPTTPLKSMPPHSAELMQNVFLSAMDIVSKANAKLGPSCIPCTHNTLTLVGGRPLVHRGPLPRAPWWEWTMAGGFEPSYRAFQLRLAAMGHVPAAMAAEALAAARPA